MSDETIGSSAAFAGFVADATPDATARQRAVQLLAAAATAARAGGGATTVAASAAALDPAPAGRTVPLGGGPATSVASAALLGGVAAGLGASSAAQRAQVAVAAATVAVAQHHGVTGSDVVDALAVGAEIAGRVVAELERAGYAARGWDPTGAGGSIGAAAATARLLGLSDGDRRQALGIAATQAAGLAAAAGTGTWALHVGKAAANGVEAALVRAAGFSGPPAGIEGRRGLLAVAAPDARDAALHAGLGTSWDHLHHDPSGGVDDDVLELATSLAASDIDVPTFVGTTTRSTP